MRSVVEQGHPKAAALLGSQRQLEERGVQDMETHLALSHSQCASAHTNMDTVFQHATDLELNLYK